MASRKIVENTELALQGIAECVAGMCRCGHFDSEHLLTKRLQPSGCKECKCLRFKTAFKLERLGAKKK